MKHLWRVIIALAIVVLSFSSALIPVLNDSGTALAAGEIPMEDISSATGGWTHVDAIGYTEETPYRISWDGLPRNNDDTKHYIDLGASGIAGNFSDDFASSFYASGGATGIVGIFVMSDVQDCTFDILANVAAHSIAVYISDTDAVATLYLAERNAAHSDAAVSQIIDDKYRCRTLWYRLARSTNDVTLTVYDNPSRVASHLLYTLTHAWSSAPSFQYLYMLNSWGNGAAIGMEGFTSELYYGAQPETFAEYNQSLPFKADQTDGFEDFTEQSADHSNDATWDVNLMGGTTIDVHIAADADDTVFRWETDSLEWDVVAGDSASTVGSDISGVARSKYGNALRFVAAIPMDSEILEAKLYVYAHDPAGAWTVGAGPWYSTICGHLAESPAVISDNTDYEARRGTEAGGANNDNRTIHEQSWTLSTWTDDTWYESPDIKDVIQEISDDVAADITHIMLFWDDHDYRSGAQNCINAHNWDSGGALESPRLVIKYKAPGTTNNASHTISGSWAKTGGYSAKFVADEADDIDYQAVLVPDAYLLDGAILEADVQITSLGAGEITQLVTLHCTSHWGITVQVREVGGLYEWGMWRDSVNTDYWSGKYLTLSHSGGYHITLDCTVHQASFNPNRPRATLHVDGELVQSLYWVGGGGFDEWAIDEVILGFFETNYGGTRYIDNFRFMDGGTYFPSIARGGEDEGTLIFSSRVSDSHGDLGGGSPTETYGESRLDTFYSFDDGVSWTWFDTIGPTATQEYAECEVRWNGYNEKWYAFVHRQTDPAVDPTGTYVDRGLVYELEDPTTGTWTLVRDWGADLDLDITLFPTRMVDATDGSMIVGITYKVDGLLDPVSKYCTAAHFSIDTYTLERESEPIFRYGEDATYNLMSEPMVWRDSEGNMSILVRMDNVAGGVVTQIWTRTSNGDTDGDWSVAYNIASNFQYEAKSGLLRALVFQGDAWFQYRHAKDDSALVDLNDWGTCMVRADRDTMDIKTEMWWYTLGEGGNGDIDCRQRQFDGAFTMDFASGLHGQAWFMELDHFTGIPYVTTEPAFNVGVTRAGVRGYLDDGATCEYRFVYGTSEAYDSATAWTSSVDAGEFFRWTLTSLVPSVTYHYRAECRNSYGTAYGIDRVFTTALTVGTPSNFLGIAISMSEISLSWESGTGATESIVRGKMGSYPTSITDGFAVYSGEKSAYIKDNCTAGTTYFFAVWGHDEPDYYSTTCAKTAVTTPAGLEYVFTVPTGASGDPVSTMIDTTDFNEQGDWIADALGMQHGLFYGLFFGVFASIVSVMISRSSKSMLVTLLLVGGFACAGAVAGICSPVWIFLYVLWMLPLTYLSKEY